MQIRKELDSEVQLITEFLLLLNKHSTYPKLHKSGKIMPELSLVASSKENEKFLPYIGYCEVEVDGQKQLFIAGLLPDVIGTKNIGLIDMLFAESQKIAKSLGYTYIYAFDNSGFLEQKFGFKLTNFTGFFLEGENKTPQILKVFKLDENAENKAQSILFPDETGVRIVEPLFSQTSSMDEELYRKAIFKTREKARRRYNLIYIATIFFALAYAVFERKIIGLGIAIASAFVLTRSIINPINLAKQHLQYLKDEYGTCDGQCCVFFLDDFLVFYDMISKATFSYSYDDLGYLYLKKDYLFICKHDSSGDYMAYKDMTDKKFIIDFLINKCKNIKILK